jgi:hypothetical protein
MVGPLLMCGVFFFSREVRKDVFRNFFSAKISSGSRLKLKSKKDESRDCNQDEEKGMRRRDYSRMVRFFDGRLFSSRGFFPLSAMALGVFSGGGGREGVRRWKCVRVGLQSTEELFY